MQKEIDKKRYSAWIKVATIHFAHGSLVKKALTNTGWKSEKSMGQEIELESLSSYYRFRLEIVVVTTLSKREDEKKFLDKLIN